jgi:tetratricopeptide (TPR) repeat protein
MKYMTYATDRSHKNYLLCIAFFTLALMSKPMAVSLPVVLLILDWYPLKRIQSMKSFWSGLFEKLPFIALSLVSSVLTILAQNAGGAMAMTASVPLSTRLLVAVQSLISYLGKMLLPMNLNPYYPYPKEVSLLSWQYLSAIALVLGITVACVVLSKTRKVWLAAWGYYVVTLIPVIGIVQVGGQAMADRYMYLPCLGPFLLVGVLAARVWGKLQTPGRQRQGARFLSIAAAMLVLLSLAYFTSEHMVIWRNSLTLWNYVIEKEPETVPLAYNNRGLVFSATGQFERAIADFDKAVSLNPSDYEGYNNRALTFSQMGRFDEAIADFDKAIALNRRFYQAYNNKGKLYGEASLFDKAIEQFNNAIDINPDSSLAYGNRGLAYSLIGEDDKALKDLNRAVESDEHNVEAYGARGNLYLRAGDRARAISDFQRACDLGDEKGCDVLQRYLK